MSRRWTLPLLVIAAAVLTVSAACTASHASGSKRTTSSSADPVDRARQEHLSRMTEEDVEQAEDKPAKPPVQRPVEKDRLGGQQVIDQPTISRGPRGR